MQPVLFISIGFLQKSSKVTVSLADIKKQKTS
jgi:hypothetical protein